MKFNFILNIIKKSSQGCRMKTFCFFMVLLLVGSYSVSFAYDDERTHPHITRNAILKSNLNTFLQQYLGLRNSTDPARPGTFLSNDKYVTEVVIHAS